MHVYLKVFGALALAIWIGLLGACSSSVLVNDSKKLVEAPSMLTRLQVVYQTPVWTTQSTSGGTPLNLGDNNFSGFGKHIVASAGAAFHSYAVAIVDVRELAQGAKINISPADQGGFGPATAILLISPSKGKTQSGMTTRRGTEFVSSNVTADYEISLTLIDLALKKPVWQAHVKTSTYMARNVANQKTGSGYDAEMARQVWEAIVAKMKADGLI